MSNYIGNQPAFGEFKKLDSLVSLFNGSTTQFNLTYNTIGQSVGDSTQLIVSLNGIVQEPGAAYTLGIGGGSIVFSSAPASTDTCHIVLLGGVGATGTVADGSITATKLASNLRDLLEEEFTANGSATTFTMARTVSYSNQLLVTIDGIVQPTSAYSVSGTTLTISPALPNTTDIRVLHVGIPGAFNSANSIIASMLSSTGGTANQVLAVNAGATGIEFQTVSGGGSALTVQEEGSSLSTAATTLNFVGSSVTATGSGATKTITISGGGGGGTGQTITAITANTTLSNSDKGKLIQTETAGITITIPALSSLDADWFIDIETLNTNTFNHGKVTLDITTNNSGASINRGGNETMYGASKIRLQRSPAGGDSQGQLSAFASNYLTGGIIVREDRLAGGLQGGDVGVGSIMLGNAQDASGNDAIAIGQLGSASATGSVAIGSYNGSSATTVAAATGAVAIGSGRAGGTRSLAMQIQNSGTSYGATAANAVAIGNIAKASGQNSFALGNNTIASGSYSVAHGYQGQTPGSGSFCTGSNSIAEGGSSAVIGGRYGHAKEYGKIVFSGGNYLNDGNTINLGFQAGILSVAGTTTDATTRALTSYNNTASTTNQLILPNNSAFTFTGTIIAREKASAGSDYASWEVKGTLLRDANAASTVLGVSVINKLYATSGASAWVIALSADTTNGGLKVEVTGAASTNIRWATSLHTTEVIFA